MVISASHDPDKRDPLDAMLMPLGLAAAAMILGQIGVMLFAGIGQETFEIVRPDYADQLRAHATAARMVFTFDSLLIVSYGGFFVVLARRLSARVGWLIPGAGLLFAALFGLLDAYENANILSFLGVAELGGSPDMHAIAQQMALSQLKFHLSYVAIFFFAMGYPRDTLPAKILVSTSLITLPVLGLVIFVVPPEWFMPLNIARWSIYAIGLPLGAYVARSG